MSYNSKYKSSEIEEILDSVGGKQDKLKVVEISLLTITDLKDEVVINLTDEQNSLLAHSNTIILMAFKFPNSTYSSRCVLYYSLTSIGKSYTGITSRARSFDKKGDNIFVKAVRDNTAKTLTISFSDIIVTKDSLKTINGESIIGSGDITISGGSSSGIGAYSEVNHGTSDTTFALTPNTFHIWDEVGALTLTLGSEIAGVANEYLFQFASGATATVLTLPDDIKWANDAAPTIAENMIYQVSILKGLASVLEFSNAVVSSIFPATLTVGDNGDLGVSVYETLYEGVVLQEGDLTLIVDGENYSITEYEFDIDYSSNGGFQLLYLEDGPMRLYYILESSGEVNRYVQ